MSGVSRDEHSFVCVNAVTGVRQIAAGGGFNNAHTVVVTVDGIFVFGSNSLGQLGLAPSRFITTPMRLDGIPPWPASSIVVSCGWLHTLQILVPDLCEAVIDFLPLRDRLNLSVVNSYFDEIVRTHPAWEDALEAALRARLPEMDQIVWRCGAGELVVMDHTVHDWKAATAVMQRERYSHICSEDPPAANEGEKGLLTRLTSWFKTAHSGFAHEHRVIMLGLGAAGEDDDLVPAEAR